MARQFTQKFLDVAARARSRAYFVLEIQWPAADQVNTYNTKFYIDRPPNSFAAAGVRIPTVENPRVLEWGANPLTLKEGQVGAHDRRQVVLHDKDKALTTLLFADFGGTANPIVKKPVRIYRMFDDPDCVWPDDRALVFAGVVRPFRWTDVANDVVLEIEDEGLRLTDDVACIAKKDSATSCFTEIPDEWTDKPIPIVWGRAPRVPAVLAKRPIRTTITQMAEGGSATPTVEISDHPDDMGVATGAGNPQTLKLGTDTVDGYFTQSSDPDNTPSTFTFTSTTGNVIGKAFVGSVIDPSEPGLFVAPGRAGNYVTVWSGNISPDYAKTLLATVAPAGTTIRVRVGPRLTANAWMTTTIAAITADTPWLGHYKVTFSDTGVMALTDLGDEIEFVDATADRQQWPAGTILEDDGDWVYIANCHPSKAVLKVEGYGQIKDSSGDHRSDFIQLGGFVVAVDDGTTVIEGFEFDGFTVNLNDDQFADCLGHNVTTITFDGGPRALNENLQEDGIWVTLLGIEDEGDSTGTLIDNPALVILQYLQELMGIDASLIDTASFTEAAAELTGRKVGFAQMTARRGVELLQDIARQCHSVLFFDQGKVRIRVLSNSIPEGEQDDFSEADDVLEGTLVVELSGIDEIVTAIDATWRREWHDKEFPDPLSNFWRENKTASAIFGLQKREMDFWLYWRKSDVESEVDFWLTRWSRVYQNISFETSHQGLHLEPGDWISVSFTDRQRNIIFDQAELELLEVTDRGPSAVVEVKGRTATLTAPQLPAADEPVDDLPSGVDPPVITSQPTAGFAASGDPHTLSVTATGSGLTYQWYDAADDSAVVGETASTFDAEPGETTSYYVIVSNSGGSVQSDTVTVTWQVRDLVGAGQRTITTGEYRTYV